MPKAKKNRASKAKYTSVSQMELPGFESPFAIRLDADNRWVKLSRKIPWDEIAGIYNARMGNQSTGAGGINPRVVLGSLIIKHLCDLSDAETVQHISENVYMQYFLGYSGFCGEPPFDPSLFVEFRKRLGKEVVNEINERIMGLEKSSEVDDKDDDDTGGAKKSKAERAKERAEVDAAFSGKAEGNQGKLLMDATACPQDIRYPTDLDLLNDAREKSEELIDVLYGHSKAVKKPRTYRKTARKRYLGVAQKRQKSKLAIRRAIKVQLGYLNRNIRAIEKLLDEVGFGHFCKANYKYWLVIQELYRQQNAMCKSKTHTVEHRIVSIHQPHVRPIVRGKSKSKVEFGAKVHVSQANGIVFLDRLSWEAFNEGAELRKSVEKYKQRFGYYPKEVLADKIYCTRENRAWLKRKGIKLKAKPLGRPAKEAVQNHVSPGERNPIEGVFGQSKRRYGLGCIGARLRETSESWIATIIMVLNLVNLARGVLYCLFSACQTFSAWVCAEWERLQTHAGLNTGQAQLCCA